MKTFFKAFAATTFFSTAALAGSAEFHPSTYTTYKKHAAHSGSVTVLSTLPRNELSYTEIGMVRIPTQKVSNYGEALDYIKNAAAKHGGTAIVLEDDAKLFMAGGVTSRGTAPRNVSAIALIRH